MGRLISRKQLWQERAAHAGQSKYVIFKKEPGGGRREVLDFWAEGDAAALERLEMYKRKLMLVDPAEDASSYFYSGKNEFTVARGNGMVEVYDSIERAFAAENERESAWERIKFLLWRAADWFSNLRWAFADFWYWWRHYDSKTHCSRQRTESWNLDIAVLSMLEFNVPLIMENKHTVPCAFCAMARERLRPGAAGSAKAFDEEETRVGGEMWRAELERLLGHIRLYNYYRSNCLEPPGGPGGAYPPPVKPGTDGELDIGRADAAARSEWRAIWRWMSAYGEHLWT